MSDVKTKRAKLQAMLYEWFVTETCDDCQHILSFRDGDARHPCNKCECYERFRIADSVKEDLKDKVNQILDVFNGKDNNGVV